MAKEPVELSPTEKTPEQGLPLRVYFQEYKAARTPPDSLLARIMADAPSSSQEAPTERAFWSGWRAWFSGMSAVAACAVLLLWFQPSFMQTLKHPAVGKSPSVTTLVGGPEARRAPPVLTSKGAEALSLLHSRKTLRGHTHKQLTRDGVQLSEGDLVQLKVQAKDETHVMMVSLNSKGEISLFVPFGKAYSARVARGSSYLPATGSLELDGYVGKELFFLLSSPRQFLVKDVKKALRKAMREKKERWFEIRKLEGPWEVRVLAVRKQKPRW